MTTYCSKCGSIIPDGAPACANCGSAGPSQMPVYAAPMFAPQQNLEGLSGWLILVGLGQVLSLFQIARTIFTVNLPVLTGQRHQDLLSGRPGLAALVASEFLMNVLFILALVILNYFFFTRRRSFPAYFIAFHVAHVCLLTANHVAFSLALPSADLSSGLAAVARSAVTALIWIPYMLVSRRVKATFTQ